MKSLSLIHVAVPMFDVGSELIVILDLTSCVQNQLNVLTNEKKKRNGNKSREAVGILTCVSEKASGV